MSDLSGTGILLSEFIGTALLLLLGIGVGANTTLSRSFGHGRDWLLISLGWGFAVFVGASVAWRSGAQLNPAVTLALAMTGSVPWHQVPWFFLAQVLGAMAGALLAYLTYKKQFDTHDDPAGDGRGVLHLGLGARAGLEPAHRGHRRLRARLLGAGEHAVPAGHRATRRRSSATPRWATPASPSR